MVAIFKCIDVNQDLNAHMENANADVCLAAMLIIHRIVR